jgi:hypothetical protein
MEVKNIHLYRLLSGQKHKRDYNKWEIPCYHGNRGHIFLVFNKLPGS